MQKGDNHDLDQIDLYQHDLDILPFASRVAVDDERPEESSGIMKQIAFLEVPLLLFSEHVVQTMSDSQRTTLK